MNDVRVAAIQMICPVGDVMTNSRRAFTFLERALVDELAELVVLPEMFLSGYLLDERARGMAEKRGSALLAPLIELAETHEAVIVAPTLWRGDGGQVQSAAVVLADGGLRGVASRRSITTDAERAVLSPGTGPCAIDTPLGVIGVVVGTDARAADTVAARLGADIRVVCLAAASDDADAMRTDARALARATGCPVIVANQFRRPGGEPASRAERVSDYEVPVFAGGSCILAATGDMLAERADGNGVVVADVS